MTFVAGGRRSRQAREDRFKVLTLKRFLQSEIGAAMIWVIGSLVAAAVLAPWAFQGGKWLADIAAVNELPGFLEWVAASCGRAKLSRFFDRSLMICALISLPFLTRRIRSLRHAGGVVSALERHSTGAILIQISTGLLVAGGLFWGLGLMLEVAGAYQPKDMVPGVAKLFKKALLPAVGASLVEEWLFRGILLGIWLRFSRPVSACLGSSLLFAFLHFLNPPAGVVIANPAGAFAGFELLGKILLHFTDPLFFLADFATLVAVGMLLAWTRVRTGALWFPIGLHAGWIMAFKSHNLFYQNVTGHSLHPWAVGESLRSGLLPLLTLAITALLCRFLLRLIVLPREFPQPRITVTTNTL